MRLILAGILLFVANSVLAQNRESLIVATDRLTDSLCVLDSIDGSRMLQVFQVKCDTNDFVFMGMLVLPSSKKIVSLFSERNSSEHLTRYYYYDFVTKRLYVTPYFSEAEVPSFFSLDVAKQELFYVSIHRKEPGTFLKKSVSVASCDNAISYKKFEARYKPIKRIAVPR
ncbi:MAG TPA: hypothetical protein VMW01_07935 [Williamwhitmania sp.]|jgi:hypothetical protein|nr:hypothetical protein [Williamwhitmania sp.]